MTAVQPNEVVKVGIVEIGNARKLAIIAGPCQLESRAHAFEMAAALKEITDKAGVGLIYKTSFDKANRTSGSTARGMGLELALPIFADIRERFGLPCSPTCMSATNAPPWPKRWTCCRSRLSSAARPTC